MKKFVTTFIFIVVNSTLFSQINIKVTTDKQQYHYRDSIRTFVTATNTSGHSITLNWNTTCQAKYEIIGQYNWSNNHVCYNTPTSLTLDTAESHTWSFTYHNHLLNAGNYKIFGEVFGYGISDTVEFNIDNKIIAYYSAVVKNSDNQPVNDVIVRSEGASKSITDNEGKFTLQYTSLIFSDSSSIAYPVITYYHTDYYHYGDTISISEGDSIIGPDVTLNNLISFTGNVKYENGEPVLNSEIRMFSSDNSYYSSTDKVGNYQINCLPGNYYLNATVIYDNGDSWTYRYIYYNNKTDLASADLINIDSTTNGINFSFPLLVQGTISGKVIDASTQQPISNVMITVSSEFPRDTLLIFTDLDGFYTIPVYEGSYNVSAVSYGYLNQFYKNAYNVFDATPVKVDKDNLNITGIDFKLTKPVPGSNTISGVVQDKKTYAFLNDIEVYAIPKSGGIWTKTTTSYNGQYLLNNLENDSYILLFYNEKFKSQFYADNGKTCSNWENATVFNLTGEENLNNFPVYLDSLNTSGGEISGRIYYNLDSTLNGTLISAIDTSGNIASTSVSIYNGSYHIPSLKNGSYLIQASKVGNQTIEYDNKINIDLGNKPTVDNVDLFFNLTGAEKNINEVPHKFKLFQNFPNPFNPTTTIEYQIPKESVVSIIVFDVLGREIVTLVNEKQNAGHYKVKFNASKLSTGIYFCRINTGNYFAVNKMLLLK